MANILIAGCGYVGLRLAELLTAEGHAVWALSRSEKTLPEGVTPVQADLTAALPDDLVGAALDVVFYTGSATGRREEAVYRAIYVEGTRNLLDWLARNHPDVQRFIFTSSTSVYGQTQGEWVDENAPTDPAGFSGREMLAGEAVVRDAFCCAVVVRFSGIYGPGRMGWTQRAPKTHRYTNHIHREDCARVLWHLMGIADPEKCYLATDCEPYIREGVEGVMTAGRGSGNKRCSNRRLLDSGYEFVYPTYREGVAHEIG